jgi:NTE family protein
MVTALVLGGGGARGLAHLGVLKVLEQENIKFDMIVGCSFGALIGGMYAQTANFSLVQRKMEEFKKSKEYRDLGVKMLQKPSFASDDFMRQFARNIRDRVLLNVIVNRISVLKENRLINSINFLIDDDLIENTKIKFACNTTDLVSGRPILFTKGDMREAVLASTTIPGYFPPLEVNGKRLVDGAVTYNLPIKFAKALGAKNIIAVDVHSILQRDGDFKNVFDVILRTSTITSAMLTEETMDEADVIITPDVGKYLWYDFDKSDELISAGEEATYNKLSDVYAITSKKNKWDIIDFFKKGIKRKQNYLNN